MEQILPDDEIAERINTLSSKQWEVLNVAQTWVKESVKYNECNAETVYNSNRNFSELYYVLEQVRIATSETHFDI